MNSQNIYILLSAFIVSLGSLVGIFTVAINEKKLSKFLLHLVSLSAGALIGGAFLHLLPEASENLDSSTLFTTVLFAFVFFFLVEKVLHWRHCHKGVCENHSFGLMNLFGDSFHNFLDGLIISTSFVADIRLGIITTIAVALHEIPQEIGDFGVLLYAGFSKKKALISNFLVAQMVMVGAITGILLSSQVSAMVTYLLPFAAGGFIYIASSDLMPELRKETRLNHSISHFCIFLLGILLMYSLKVLK